MELISLIEKRHPPEKGWVLLGEAVDPRNPSEDVV